MVEFSVVVSTQATVMSKAERAYFEMVDRWRQIVAQPISKEAKQERCLSLLREFIDDLARARINGPDRPIRFYADMCVLEHLVRPNMFATDELGEVAIRPAYAIVEGWMEEHRFSSGEDFGFAADH